MVLEAHEEDADTKTSGRGRKAFQFSTLKLISSGWSALCSSWVLGLKRTNILACLGLLALADRYLGALCDVLPLVHFTLPSHLPMRLMMPASSPRIVEPSLLNSLSILLCRGARKPAQVATAALREARDNSIAYNIDLLTRRILHKFSPGNARLTRGCCARRIWSNSK